MLTCHHRKLVALLLPIATFALLPGKADAQESAPSAKLQAITQMLQREVDVKRIPGAVAAISHRGKVIYFEAVGHHDAESKQEMKSDAIFRIASMTCLLYTSPSPRDQRGSRMPSSA